jgi:LacI family transcriptional regulator
MAEIEARRRRRRKRVPVPVDPATQKPTLKTIAQMTGLAVTTISRALNNAPELAADTRERVQRIAAEIGYMPDRAALRLKTGRTHVISLILDPHDEILGFGNSLVTGIIGALRGTPYHLIITPNFRQQPPIEPIQYIVRNRMADGVIFSRTEPNDPRVTFLIEHNFPFVSHGRTQLPVPHPFVDYDNDSLAYQAARRLIEKGRRRLAMILPDSRFNFGTHLREGFLRAASEAGVAQEFMDAITLDDSPDEIRQATTARMRAAEPPDGFFCPGDASALAVMAGVTDAGLRIGADVDLVAKRTSALFNQVRPPVDSLFEDIPRAGEMLGKLLLGRINGEPVETLQFLDVPEARF